MKKKLFSILLILLIVLSCFYSNSYATSNINIEYNPYEYMSNDVDIVKNWARNNFSTFDEFTTFLFDNFSYILPSSRKYFTIGDSYSSQNGDIVLVIYGTSNIGSFSTIDYYGGVTQAFGISGNYTTVTIRPSDSSLSNSHFISSVDTRSTSRTAFIGYYKLKIDYAFSDSDFYDEINNNLSEIATSIEDTRTYLSDDTIYSDNEISSDKTDVTSIIQPEIDNLNDNSLVSNIYYFYDQIVNADTYADRYNTLDLDFYIFNTHVTGTLNRTYTADLLLKLCNNDTVTRNIIRNIIRSVYYFIFFLYFGKKYINAFHKIITANFDGFTSGVDLINAL